MHKDIADLWIAALRDPDTRQVRNAMTTQWRDAFCPLGLLCELACRNGVEVSIWLGTNQYNEPAGWYNTNGCVLPDTVCKWAGIRNASPVVPIHEPYRYGGANATVSLRLVNDYFRYSFVQIADLIEQHWESF